MKMDQKNQTKWTPEESNAAQDFFCDSNGYPRFAPDDGICYRCGQNIFSYYSPKKAASKLITSCPYCNASFTD